jgi:hypothetical protein
LHCIQTGDDLLVSTLAVGPHRRELQAIERTLACQGFPFIAQAPAVFTRGIFFAHEHSHERIVPQLVVVVEIFVTQTQCENALLQEIFQGVLDQVGIAVVDETIAGEPADEVELGLDLAEEQAAAIRCHLAPIEGGCNFPRSEALEKQRFLVTLCHGGVPPWVGIKLLC